MIEAFWIPLLPPYLIGLVLSFLVEALLTPRPVAPWRRPAAAVGVHVGVWTLAFALELMLFRRPYFAVANVLAIELLIVLVSNAKYQALREPFVYPDFEYFTDAIKHPRLYLPFFGIGRAIAAGGGYGIALWAGLLLEESVTAGAGIWLVSFAELQQEHMFDPVAPLMPFFAHTVGWALLGWVVAWLGGKRIKVSFHATEDLQLFGLLGALWAYGVDECAPVDKLLRDAPFAGKAMPATLPRELPDLVTIQSESFFDARRAYPQLKPELLVNFDTLKAEGIQHGALRVVAWGANTVRTEFAYLSGLDSEVLGVHRYNPYRRLARYGVPTVASYLRQLGYRTVCVHPYHASFYARNEILPILGFDEFIDIRAFADAKRDGPYVGDRAVANQVNELLRREGGAPLYVHVITMENHGPLHWESVAEDDDAQVLTVPRPKGAKDLIAYARHLRNADAMFGLIRAELQAQGKPAVLCVYGDHVPIMPDVYRHLGEVDGTTDYVVWHAAVAGGASRVPLAVNDLPFVVLRAAGLWQDEATQEPSGPVK